METPKKNSKTNSNMIFACGNIKFESRDLFNSCYKTDINKVPQSYHLLPLNMIFKNYEEHVCN